MKRILAITVALFALPTAVAFGQSALNQYQPGFRTINGSQLNLMVNQVNALTGLSGNPGSLYGSTLVINASTGPVARGSLFSATAGTTIRTIGPNTTNNRILNDAFAGIPVFTARRTNGTIAAPTAIVSGNEFGSYNAHGLNTTATYTSAIRMSAYATENWSATAAGSKIVFSTIPNTTLVLTDVLTIDQDGGLKGTAAAQGTALNLTGGTSSTAGNAGGAVTATGGVPGSAGVGGAVTIAGGAGGSASGTGGLVSITGGIGTAGNAQGGLARAVGGAGQGSAAGGAALLTGGAGGATGTGGAITITSGIGGGASGAAGAVAITAATATSANGASVTVTAGAGAGGTNAGGSVNLVPGAAVSTGIPGTVQVNGDANLMCATFSTGVALAANTDQVFYIATRAMMVVSVSEVHAVAAGGASKLQVTKDSTTAAPGAGTDLLTNNTNAGFDLAATANTVQVGTLTATVATKTLAAGDRLAVDFADAVQSTAGVAVTACMAPL